MPPKKVALLFLTVACAILLVHSIIPHHHHESLAEAALHHLYEHISNHSADTKASGHQHTPHLVHNAEFGEEFRAPSQSVINFSQQPLFFFSFVPFTNSLLIESNYVLESKPPDKIFLIYPQPYIISSGLRAPPAFFI